MLNNSKNKGITLIALVVSIIVLLILAGVSVQMLTGENGIINRAIEAKNNTEKASIIEQAKIEIMGELATEKYSEGITDIQLKEILEKYFYGVERYFKGLTQSITTKTGGYSVNVSEIINGITIIRELPQETGTFPYLPKNDGTWHKVAGTNLNNGLVISDNQGNEYVWIEVPRTTAVYGSTFNMNYDFDKMTETEENNAYTAIKEKLIAYAGFATDGTWSASGADAKTKKCGWKDEWYDGCGLTSSDYTIYYNSMLKSVYENGGFWIGRYEAGIDGSDNETATYTADNTTTVARTSHTTIDSSSPKAVSKQNCIPYNWVYCSEAQYLSNNMNSGDHKISLMFGLQWDLVIKYLEQKATWSSGTTAETNLKTNSQYWGNYCDSQFTINRGRYVKCTDWNINNKWYSYEHNENNYVVSKEKKSMSEGNGALLTTGATDVNIKQNIYDLAGNVWEWTLEHTTSSSPCSSRGGYFSNTGSYGPASKRSYYDTTYSMYHVGFRVTIY